jgi:hypothetical protein
MTAPAEPTRRRAEIRGPRTGAVAAAVLVAMAVGLLGAVEAVTPPASPDPRASRVTPDSSITACLPAATRVGVRAWVLAGAGQRLSEGGSVEVERLSSSGAAPRTVQVDTPRGRSEELPDAVARDGFVVRATGEAAAARMDHLLEDVGPDAALRRCLPPRARWWFAGAGAGLDHTSAVVLANVDDGPAVVDVTVWSTEGVVDAVGTRGLTLAPGEARTVDLLDVAPQADELAVRVQTSRGRVVAAVADRYRFGARAGEGFEWLPPHERPARRLLLGPAPTATTERTLVVTNPGAREALVEVEVSGATGSFAPTRGARLRVAPGTVGTLELGSLGEEPATVALRSAVPVVATLRVVTGPRAGAALAYAGPAPTLRDVGLGVLPGGGLVQLAAADEGAEVRLVAVDAAGRQVGSAEVALDPGATGAWRAPRRTRWVRVQTGAAPVRAWTVTDGGTTAAPVVSGRFWLRRPAVTPMLPAVVGEGQPSAP